MMPRNREQKVKQIQDSAYCSCFLVIFMLIITWFVSIFTKDFGPHKAYVFHYLSWVLSTYSMQYSPSRHRTAVSWSLPVHSKQHLGSYNLLLLSVLGEKESGLFGDSFPLEYLEVSLSDLGRTSWTAGIVLVHDSRLQDASLLSSIWSVS